MIDMIDTRAVHTELEGLANRVTPTDKNAAQRLRNLDSAVNGGLNANAWAASDIHQLIDPDLIVERFKRQRTTNGLLVLLEGLRTIFIFLPLIVTWGGISQAVTSYSDLIKVNSSDISLPFLFLWQRGFDGRLQSWQTLGSLAGIDFALLSFVVILSILIFFLSDLIKTNKEREGEELRGELLHAIARASLCLAKTRRQSPGGAVSDFNQSMNNFDAMIRQLLTQLKDITDRQGLQQQFFDDFRRDLVTVLTSMSRTVNDLRASNTNLMNSMGALVQPTQNIAGNINGLATNAQQAVNLFQGQISAQQAIVQAQNNWGAVLQGVLTNLEQAVQSALAMAQSTTAFMQEQQQLVKAMTNERDEQTKISNDMRFAYKNMESFVTELDRLSTQISQLVTYMNNVAGRIANLQQTPPTPPPAPTPRPTPTPTPWGGPI